MENFPFAMGIFSGFLAFLLYSISPEDLDLRLSSPFASRFIWTPAIPILVGLSSFFLLFGSLSEKFNKTQTYISSVFLSTLVVMSFQFAVSSPMGPDGWFFVEASVRFRDYGSMTREYYSYFDHPLIMVLVQPFITIWPSHAALFASIIGFLLGVTYFSVVYYAISQHENFEQWGVLASLFFAALLSIYWNPIQFSAQLLSLVMIYSTFHIFLSKDNHKMQYAFLVAILLPVAHLFAPIFLIAALLTESFLRTELSSKALLISFICSVSFLLWNLTQAEAYFLNQIKPLPDSLQNLATSLSFTLFFCVLLHALLFYRIKKMGRRKDAVWGEGSGIRNLSILFGCLALLPILYLQDAATLAARFTPRLIVYSVVPLVVWSRYPIEWANSIIDQNFEVKTTKLTAILLASVLLSGITVFGHTNLADRTWILPEETSDCWDDSEELGIPVLMTRTRNSMDDKYYEGSTILISPMVIAPSLPIYYYKLVDNGDGSISEYSEINNDIVAIIMTSDMPIRLERDGPNINFEEYTQIGSTNNACEYWVKNNVMDNLDTLVPWDTELIPVHETP